MAARLSQKHLESVVLCTESGVAHPHSTLQSPHFSWFQTNYGLPLHFRRETMVCKSEWEAQVWLWFPYLICKPRTNNSSTIDEMAIKVKISDLNPHLIWDVDGFWSHLACWEECKDRVGYVHVYFNNWGTQSLSKLLQSCWCGLRLQELLLG